MPWESDEEVKAGRDWSRIMWIGVALLVAAGVAAVVIPRGQKWRETQARVKHILIKVESNAPEAAQAAYDEARAIRQRILNGESFAKLAAEYSDDSWSAARGGDLGWVRRGDLTEAIDGYIWIAPVGQVSEIMLTSQGLHLVLVTERHFSAAEKYEQELKDRVLQGEGAPGSAAP
jgi:parvulin-like peptidyl-prolyl isomerase